MLVYNANGNWSGNHPKCGGKQVLLFNVHNFSHEDVAQNVSGNAASPSSIHLSWTLPLQPNNITDYFNYYIIESKDFFNCQAP